MAQLFHNRYTNNFSVVLANREFKLDALKTNRRTLLEHLNQASYGLQRFIGSRLNDPALPSLLPPGQRQALEQLCQNWREQINLGNSFLTYDYAEVCMGLLTEANYPLLDQLRSDQYRLIAQRFVDIPLACKAFVKVSSYVDFEQAQVVLDGLVAKLAGQPGLFRYVERIEMARTDFPLTLESGEIDYPTFSLFLDQQAVQTRQHPLIGEVVTLVREATEGLPHRPVQSDYNHAITSTITVSQGYRNYKKYLRLLDLLDSVYTRDSNYAYLH